MPVTPYNACNVGTAAGSNTQIITVGTGTGSPSGTAAGDLVWAVINVPVTGQSVSNVADSQGNPWASANAGYAAGTNQNQWVWASLTTKALVSGTDTITVTYGLTTGTKNVIVRACPGIASAAPDIALPAHATSTAPSVASGTLAQPSELVIGTIATSTAGGTPSGISFGSPLTITSASSSITEFDEIVASTASQTASGTIVSAIWSATITTFRLVGPPLPGPVMSQAVRRAAFY